MHARAICRVVAATLLGVLNMSTTAIADDKKDPAKAESYDLKCTVRYWDGKKFIKGVENVPAYKVEKDGATRIYTRAHTAREGNPVKDSELIIGEETWVVEKVTVFKGVATLCTVKLKPKG